MAASTTTPSIPPAARETTGFGWRISVSIASVFGWVIFVLLYFAFWANLFTGLQSAVLVLVSILVFIAVNAAAWAPWGARFARPT